MARDTEKTSAKKAEIVRSLLQTLLRAKVKTKAAKQSLATAVGVSTSAIDQMLYYGEGGLDVWTNALMHVYDVDVDMLTSFLAENQRILRKLHPTSEADKAWFALSEYFTENELLVEASLIRARVDIEVDLGLRTKASRKRRQKT